MEVNESPFVESIENERTPMVYEPQRLEPYRETTDPVECLSYLTRMRISMRATPAKMYQLFPTLMQGNARSWFDGLKPRSVTSYDDLCDNFLISFNSLRKMKKTHEDLQTIKQGMREMLSVYLTRFAQEEREVDRISDEGVLVALNSSLTHRVLGTSAKVPC